MICSIENRCLHVLCLYMCVCGGEREGGRERERERERESICAYMWQFSISSNDHTWKRKANCKYPQIQLPSPAHAAVRNTPYSCSMEVCTLFTLYYHVNHVLFPKHFPEEYYSISHYICCDVVWDKEPCHEQPWLPLNVMYTDKISILLWFKGYIFSEERYLQL